MTAALDAMVKAMAAEIERQATASETKADRYLNKHYGTAAEIDAGRLDLEKVARAGLAEVRKLAQLDGADIVAAGERSIQIGPFKSARGETLPIWTYVDCQEVWYAMVDKILEQKP